MRIKPLLTFLALTTILAFAACVPATPTIPRDTGSDGQETPGSGQTGGDSIPQTGGQGAMEDQVRQQVTQFLSQQLNAASNSIQSITLMSTEWSDSCLGLGGANESCAQVVTPGWQVTARINGQDFVLRTNEDGSVIRMDNNAGNQGQGTGTGGNQGGQQGGTGIDGTTPGGNNQSGTQTPGGTGIDGTTPGNNNQNGTGTGTGNNNQGGSNNQGNNQSGSGTGGNLGPENANDPSGRDIGGDDTRGSGNTAGSGLEVGDSGAGGNNAGGNTTGSDSSGNNAGGANNGNTGDNTAGDSGSTVPNTGDNNEVMLFLVRENDNGQAGQRFGACGDSLVGIPANVQMQQNGDLADTLRRTYDALLGLDRQSINDNSLTSVFQGTNLRLESVSVNQFGNAVVRFFGDLQLENDCDPDRVRYQLEQAARQFNGINDVEIFVNDQPLEDALPNSAAQPDQRQD